MSEYKAVENEEEVIALAQLHFSLPDEEEISVTTERSSSQHHGQYKSVPDQHVRFAPGAEEEEDDLFLAAETANKQPQDEEEEEALRKIADQEGRGTVWSATFNLINSIIGAGIIALPYAFVQGGLVMSIVLLTGLTMIVDWTVRLLLLSSKITGQTTYPTVVAAAFGRPGWLAVSLFQWLFAFGAICAYIVIIGDNLPVVLYYFWPSLQDGSAHGILLFLTHRSTIMLSTTLFIILPLSLLRDIAKLAATSTIAFLTVLYIVAVVVWEWLALPTTMRGVESPWTFANGGWLRAVGVISCAFVCHHNTFLIYTSLRKPTLKRFATVTHMSTLTSLPLSMVMALAGYLTFVEKTRANIFLNLPLSLPVTLARFAFSLNMFTTVPLEVFVAREVMEQFFFSEKEDVAAPRQKEAERQRRQRALTTESMYGVDGSEFQLVASQSSSLEDLATVHRQATAAPPLPEGTPPELPGDETSGPRPRSRAAPRSRSNTEASPPLRPLQGSVPPDGEGEEIRRILTPRGVTLEEGHLLRETPAWSDRAKATFITHRHFGFTFLLIAAALIIALATCDVGSLLEITGGICATALAYILPPAVYLHISQGDLWTWHKVPHLLCLSGGILVMFGAGGASLMDFFSASSSGGSCHVN